MTEKAAPRYKYHKTSEPAKVVISPEVRLIVEHTKSERIEDGRVFEGVRVSVVREGARGGYTPRVNGQIELPQGMTRDHFKELAGAYDAKVKELGQ